MASEKLGVLHAQAGRMQDAQPAFAQVLSIRGPMADRPQASAVQLYAYRSLLLKADPRDPDRARSALSYLERGSRGVRKEPSRVLESPGGGAIPRRGSSAAGDCWPRRWRYCLQRQRSSRSCGVNWKVTWPDTRWKSSIIDGPSKAEARIIPRGAKDDSLTGPHYHAAAF